MHIHGRDTLQANAVRDVVPESQATSSNSIPVVNPLPVSVRVLTAFFVILGVLILGIATWRIVVWRRRKLRTASQKYRTGSYASSEKIRPIGEGMPMEKQEVIVILPTEPQAASVRRDEGKWVPQVTGYNAGKSSSKNANKNTSEVVIDVKAPVNDVRSPPPTYTASTTPSSTPSSSPRPPHLNLPTVTVTHENSNLTVPAPAPSPVPSPRRASSFGVGAPMGTDQQANLKSKPSVKGQKLPRNMLVEHTFIPSLADELTIKVGETLRMLEEYEDEWCLVERLGSRSGERGVVPRFCLKERPRGHHKRGASSTGASSVRSGKSQ
ncbi:hypothetical protein ONZ51_g6433 [Trametes cubensis]|uniref:SH3 domain-containing protein n=1 Tax=Trametes cubensis TaxID=1111947 RepID=A0AAD7XCP2_9APHY|nr:hypothetical protein ONZ51_g6433 [Trametes cubensis]